MRACRQGGRQGAPNARSARLPGRRSDDDDDYSDDDNDDDNNNGDGNRYDGVVDDDDVKRNGSRDDENGQARGNHGVRGSIAMVRAHAPVPGEQLRAP